MKKVYLVSVTTKSSFGGFNIDLSDIRIGRNAEEKKFLKEHFDKLTAYIIPKSKQSDVTNFYARIRKKFNESAVEYEFGETILRYMTEENIKEYEKYLEKTMPKFDKLIEDILDSYDALVDDFIKNYKNLVGENKNTEKIIKKIKGDILRKKDLRDKFIVNFQYKEMYFSKEDDTYISFLAKALNIAYKRANKTQDIMSKKEKLHHKQLKALIADSEKIDNYNISEEDTIKEISKEFKAIHKFGGVGKNTSRIAKKIEKKVIKLAQELNVVQEVIN